MTDLADLVVIGAGPAGMAAAMAATASGLTCVVLDEQDSPGGQIYRGAATAPSAERAAILGPDYVAGGPIVRDFLARGIDYRPGSSVWSIEEGAVFYTRGDASAAVRARHVLIATGAMERPFPVRGWTLPGVLTVGAAQIMLKADDALFDDAVFVGTGPLFYLVAAQYLAAGAVPRLLLDTGRGRVSDVLRNLPGVLAGRRDMLKGLALLHKLRRGGTRHVRAVSDIRIEGVDRVRRIDWSSPAGEGSVDTATVLLHQGVIPNPNMWMSQRVEQFWDARQLCWRPRLDAYGRSSLDWLWIAGDGAGIAGARAASLGGALAGHAVARAVGRLDDRAFAAASGPIIAAHARETALRPFLDSYFRPLDALRVPDQPDVVVCRCEEVTRGMIAGALDEGCLGPNQMKAFLRCGMGPCNGRLCGHTVTEIFARTRDILPSEVGYYRIRTPVKPITVGQLAATFCNQDRDNHADRRAGDRADPLRTGHDQVSGPAPAPALATVRR